MTWTANYFDNHTKQNLGKLKKVIILVFDILPIIAKYQFKILIDLY